MKIEFCIIYMTHVSKREIFGKWENVKSHLVQTEQGYVILIFALKVLDKRHARNIELVRCQYSGNAHGVIHGIGVVTCVYVNPIFDRFWIIDYQIYDPAGDGKTNLDHVKEMLSLLVHQKHLLFQAVLMDSWYASKPVMLHIEKLRKDYYFPLKTNRLVDDSNGTKHYQRISDLAWTPTELNEGKRIKIKEFPPDARITSLLTTCLKTTLRLHNRRVTGAGRLSSFTEKPGN